MIELTTGTPQRTPSEKPDEVLSGATLEAIRHHFETIYHMSFTGNDDPTLLTLFDILRTDDNLNDNTYVGRFDNYEMSGFNVACKTLFDEGTDNTHPSNINAALEMVRLSDARFSDQELYFGFGPEVSEEQQNIMYYAAHLADLNCPNSPAVDDIDIPADVKAKMDTQWAAMVEAEGTPPSAGNNITLGPDAPDADPDTPDVPDTGADPDTPEDDTSTPDADPDTPEDDTTTPDTSTADDWVNHVPEMDDVVMQLTEVLALQGNGNLERFMIEHMEMSPLHVQGYVLSRFPTYVDPATVNAPGFFGGPLDLAKGTEDTATQAAIDAVMGRADTDPGSAESQAALGAIAQAKLKTEARLELEQPATPPGPGVATTPGTTPVVPPVVGPVTPDPAADEAPTDGGVPTIGAPPGMSGP